MSFDLSSPSLRHVFSLPFPCGSATLEDTSIVDGIALGGGTGADAREGRAGGLYIALAVVTTRKKMAIRLNIASPGDDNITNNESLTESRCPGFSQGPRSRRRAAAVGVSRSQTVT